MIVSKQNEDDCSLDCKDWTGRRKIYQSGEWWDCCVSISNGIVTRNTLSHPEGDVDNKVMVGTQITYLWHVGNILATFRQFSYWAYSSSIWPELQSILQPGHRGYIIEENIIIYSIDEYNKCEKKDSIYNDGREGVVAHLGNRTTANNGAPVFLPPLARTPDPLACMLRGYIIEENIIIHSVDE